MQGDELLPGGQNIVRRSTGFRAPYRRGRDRPLKPLKKLRESFCVEIGADFLAFGLDVRAMMMVSRKRCDDRLAQPLRVRVGKIKRRNLLDMVVKQPRVIDQRQQYQRLAPRQRRALSAEQRTRCKLRASARIGPAARDCRPAGRRLRLALASALPTGTAKTAERSSAARALPKSARALLIATRITGLPGRCEHPLEPRGKILP